MNERALVRNLFLVNERGFRTERGVYLENATKSSPPLTGSRARGEEERQPARNLYRGRACRNERRLQRLQRETGDVS